MTDLAIPTATATAQEARTLTDQIKVAVEVAWHLVVKAYETRAWLALGYSSWDDYCTREFRNARLRLPREDRQEVVGSLRDAGLSIRAIAAATGDSVGTIHAELAGVQNRTSAGLAENEAVLAALDEPVAPRPITGIDGKTYPQTTKKEPDVTTRLLKTRDAVADRVEKARSMAAEGYTSKQIGNAIGITDDSGAGMAHFRRYHGVEVPADAVAGRRRFDPVRIVSAAVQSVDGIGILFDQIDYSILPRDQVKGWVAVLDESIKSLQALRKQLIKEQPQP